MASTSSSKKDKSTTIHDLPKELLLRICEHAAGNRDDGSFWFMAGLLKERRIVGVNKQWKFPPAIVDHWMAADI
jgi:hypothetical protein